MDPYAAKLLVLFALAFAVGLVAALRERSRRRLARLHAQQEHAARA